jgi:hypothetical protein
LRLIPFRPWEGSPMDRYNLYRLSLEFEKYRKPRFYPAVL